MSSPGFALHLRTQIRPLRLSVTLLVSHPRHLPARLMVWLLFLSPSHSPRRAATRTGFTPPYGPASPVKPGLRREVRVERDGKDDMMTKEPVHSSSFVASISTLVPSPSASLSVRPSSVTLTPFGVSDGTEERAVR